MSHFRYAYQKIVNLKTNEKTQAEWQLSAALQIYQQKEAQIDKLLDEKQALLERMQLLSAQVVALVELQLLQAYLETLELQLVSLMAERQRAYAEVELAQSRLMVKVKDEKVWLKSREQAMNKFTLGLLAKEQHELDELATVRHAGSR